MPVVNIDENIKKISLTIEQMTQEVFRLQGMLQTFRDLKKGGLETIDLLKILQSIRNWYLHYDQYQNSQKPFHSDYFWGINEDSKLQLKIKYIQSNQIHLSQ